MSEASYEERERVAMREKGGTEIFEALVEPAVLVRGGAGVTLVNRAWREWGTKCEIRTPEGGFSAHCSGDEVRWGAEWIHRCPCAEAVFLWRATAIRGATDEWLVQAVDITSDETLRTRLELIDRAREAPEGGTFRVDLKRRKLSFDVPLMTMLGYPEGTDPTMDEWLNYIHPDDHEPILSATRAHLRGLTPASDSVVRLRRVDGDWRDIEVRVKVVERDNDGGPLALVGTYHDVTEQRRLRQQLIANDRMASLGRLSAGLAHEINNPLGYVIGNLDLIARYLQQMREAEDRQGRDAAVSRAEHALDMAREGALRVRDIVRDLQALSRAQRSSHLEIIDPNTILEPAIRLIDAQLSDLVTIEAELGEDVPALASSPAALGQLFLNLIGHVRHSVDEQTAAVVRVQTGTDDRGRAVIRVEHDLSVEDPPGGRDRGDFELGLVRVLVERLGGTLAVRDLEPSGQQLTVALPTAREGDR
ncbi:MAG: PAS domain-containing protein [Myxococcota bacterium]